MWAAPSLCTRCRTVIHIIIIVVIVVTPKTCSVVYTLTTSVWCGVVTELQLSCRGEPWCWVWQQSCHMFSVCCWLLILIGIYYKHASCFQHECNCSYFHCRWWLWNFVHVHMSAALFRHNGTHSTVTGQLEFMSEVIHFIYIAPNYNVSYLMTLSCRTV